MSKVEQEKKPHPVDVHVGKRLRFCRRTKGMNQRTLGEAIGVTFQQIQKYEHGANRMGSSCLYEFSKLLSVPISYFFEGYNDNVKLKGRGMAESSSSSFEHEEVEEAPSDKEIADLVKFYTKAKKDNRATILEMAKLMAKK